MALNHIIPSADAEESKTRLIGLVIGGAAGMASLFAPVQEFFATSAGIFTASIVSGLLAATLAGAAKQQKEKALSNADKIEEVKKRFEASISNLCPNGRTDLKEPKCFCYLEGGKKNLTHLNSATCVALFAKNDASEFRAAGDFSVSDPNEPKLGCVTRVGEFDPNCGCKKVQDTKGQNLCRKSGLASINLGNVGNAINAGQTLSTADKLFSNQLQPAQLNAANLNQNAINTKKVTDAIVAKGAEKNINFPSKDKLNLFANNLVKNIGSAKNLEAAKNSSVLASLQSSSPPKGLDPAKLKEAIAKSGVEYEGGGGKKAAAKENNDFNFGYGADTAQAGAGGGGKVEEYMEKEYDYKNNDIVKRDDVAIWDVISNRYIQSGMKRLFENAPAQ
jgi:hypothetical protein